MENIPKKYWRTVRDEKGQKIDVFLVPGHYIRDNIDLEFVEGGHNLAREDLKFIPDNTFFIEEMKNSDEHLTTLFHELIEYNKMKYHKWSYEKAHEYALKAEKIYREYLNKKTKNEDINIPINVGDEVLSGKFKNKRMKVKSIEKDVHGDPTINGKPLLRVRTIKKESMKKSELITLIKEQVKKILTEGMKQVFFGNFSNLIKFIMSSPEGEDVYYKYPRSFVGNDIGAIVKTKNKRLAIDALRHNFEYLKKLKGFKTANFSAKYEEYKGLEGFEKVYLIELSEVIFTKKGAKDYSIKTGEFSKMMSLDKFLD